MFAINFEEFFFIGQWKLNQETEESLFDFINKIVFPIC